MTVTDARFNKLESRVNEIGERLAKLEGTPGHVQGSDRKAWIPIIAPIVVFLGIVVTLAIHFDNKLSAIQTDLHGVTGRLEKVESAVKVLGDNQKGSLKQIIHDLLASAEHSDPQTTARAIQTAANLTEVLRKENQPADAAFFKDTLESVNILQKSRRQPLVALASFKAQKELAEYRSALEIVRKASQNASRCEPNLSGESAYSPTTLLPPLTGDRKTIKDVELINCPQILDGYRWDGVVFVNGRIGYRGGAVILQDVVFINCTFDGVEPGDAGARILQYAALSEKHLSIKPEDFPRFNSNGL